MKSTRVFVRSVMYSLPAFFLPLAVHAQNKYGFPDPLGGAKVPELVNRLVTATLSVVGAIFFVMFLWGGVTYLTAGGAAEKVKKAQTTLVNAVIGIGIVVLSYTLVSFVIDTLVGAQKKKATSSEQQAPPATPPEANQ